MTFGGRFASSGAFFAGRFSPNSSPLARYSLGGKAPDILGDFAAGVYALKGRGVAFDGLFSFFRLSAAWKRNALGHWVKVLAGEPRTGHHIWKDGKLLPAGLAVCSEVRTNLIRYSEALDMSAWVSSGAVTIEPSGTLAGVPAFEVRDTSDSSYGLVKQSVEGMASASTCTVQMLVAKQVNPTSAFGVRLRWNSPGVNYSGVSFDPDVGDFDLSVWGSSVLERKAEDCGDHWRVWFAVDLTGSTTPPVLELFPAHAPPNMDSTNTAMGSHRCTAFQINEGRYPQGYIKTEAAPINTASESLQIDPVTVAKAVGVFGSELIDNENWVNTSSAGGSASVSGDTLTLENVTGTARIANYVSVEAGEMYLLENSHSGEAVGTYQGGSIPIGTTTPGTPAWLFVASSEADAVSYRNFVAGTAAQISGVSLRKVTMPEALTFVMKGHMTYADSDLNPEVEFFSYARETANRIISRLQTISGPGRAYFFQASEGVASSVQTDADAYSPGIDVPFSIALCVTATEIEGFCNGVSTGKTMHGGMAELLSAAMKLFPLGTGAVEHFAVYVGNPGSAALQEVTS